MTPTATAHPMRHGLGILGIVTLALATLASGALAQSPSPAGSHGPAIPSVQPSAVMEGAGRAIACPRVRGHGFQPIDRGERRLRERLRRLDRIRERRWSGERPGRERRIAVPRMLRGAIRVATVSAIEGTTLTLVTPDGWSRSVDAAAVRMTRAGQTIAATDLRVGDRVRVQQRRADDGTWQVTRVRVLPTTVRGIIDGLTPDGFVLTTRAGESVAVRVSGRTRWLLGCDVDPTAPLVVGSPVMVRGASAEDGSLDAAVVATAAPRIVRGQEVPIPLPDPAPAASPAP